MTSNMTETIFPEGLQFYKKEVEKAPWIKGQILIKPELLNDFCKKHIEYISPKGWLTFDLKKSKNDKLYLSLNTWKPEKVEETVSPEVAEKLKQLRTGETNNGDFDVAF